MVARGKMQMSDILRNKVSIKAAYASNFLQTRNVVYRYSDVNEPWYNLACSKNIYPNWRLRQRKLLNTLKKQTSKVPLHESQNGMPGNIKRMEVSYESGDVSGDSVQNGSQKFWKATRKKTFTNLDVTGHFWWALPGSGFAERGENGKKQTKINHLW